MPADRRGASSGGGDRGQATIGRGPKRRCRRSNVQAAAAPAGEMGRAADPDPPATAAEQPELPAAVAAKYLAGLGTVGAFRIGSTGRS